MISWIWIYRRLGLLTGFDWDNQHIRMLRLKYRRGEFYLYDCDEISWCDEPVSQRDSVIERYDFIEAFKRLCQAHRLRFARIGFYLNSAQVLLKEVQKPQSSKPSEYYSRLLYELGQYGSYRADNVYLDYQPVCNDEKSVLSSSLMMAVAKRNQVDALLNLAWNCRLRCRVVDVEALLLLRFIQRLYPDRLKSNQCFMLMEYGRWAVRIHMIDDSRVYLHDQKPHELGDDVFRADISPVVLSWLKRVFKIVTLNYPQLTIKAILMYGLLADQGRKKELEQRLPVELRLLNPFDCVICPQTMAMPEQPQQYVPLMAMATRRH
ncbi:MAG: type IV pilus biogenesis protein PilM [Francisellaceae bacterium]